MAGNFFRGTTVEQDGRWGKSDEKLIAKLSKAGKFDPILNTPVDCKKVNLDVISKWVSEKLLDILGFEDDVVSGLVMNMLIHSEKNIEGKKLQLDITGFLDDKAGSFVAELWTLLVDAEKQPLGIPSAFIKKKKDEILIRDAQIQKQLTALKELPPPAPIAPVAAKIENSSSRDDVDRIIRSNHNDNTIENISKISLKQQEPLPNESKRHERGRSPSLSTDPDRKRSSHHLNRRQSGSRSQSPVKRTRRSRSRTRSHERGESRGYDNRDRDRPSTSRYGSNRFSRENDHGRFDRSDRDYNGGHRRRYSDDRNGDKKDSRVNRRSSPSYSSSPPRHQKLHRNSNSSSDNRKYRSASHSASAERDTKPKGSTHRSHRRCSPSPSPSSHRKSHHQSNDKHHRKRSASRSPSETRYKTDNGSNKRKHKSDSMSISHDKVLHNENKFIKKTNNDNDIYSHKSNNINSDNKDDCKESNDKNILTEPELLSSKEDMSESRLREIALKSLLVKRVKDKSAI